MKSKIAKKSISLIMLSAFAVTNLLSVYAVAGDLPYGVDQDVSAGPIIRSAGSTSSLDVKSPVKISNADSIVNLSLRDADIVQVLRMFADQAGMNIIFASELKDITVTMDLIDISLEQALDLVIAVSGLFYDIQGNTIIISTKGNRIAVSAKSIDTIPVQYVGAASIASFLNSNIFNANSTHPGLSKSAVVTVNPATNELIVMGTENDTIMAKRIVEQFDKKPNITTFKVNHTTPAEMADMICNTLLPATTATPGGGGGGAPAPIGGGGIPSASGGIGSGGSHAAPASRSSKAKSSDEEDISEGSSSKGRTDKFDDEDSTGFAAGVPTGFASDSGSHGGGGGNISVGGGKKACTVDMSVSGSSVSSLNFKNLTISYFPTLGTIQVIGGSQTQIDMIRDYIVENDRKTPQAYLEVQLISLSESGSKSFENSWTFNSNTVSFNAGGGKGLSTQPMYPIFFAGKGYTVVGDWDEEKEAYKVIGKIAKWGASPTLSYAMNYLIENNKGRVLANPKILVTNGQASRIDLTSDYVSKVKTEYLDNGGLAAQVQRDYNISSDQGIQVTITPFISPDGYVTLDITPEYSTIKQKLYAPSSGAGGASTMAVSENDLMATLLQRRNLNLKGVRIKDGETLVIGGLIQENEAKSVTKIPFLGDLPVIGMFFRSTSTSREKEEMVIMITPHIIVDTEDAVGTEVAL